MKEATERGRRDAGDRSNGTVNTVRLFHAQRPVSKPQLLGEGSKNKMITPTAKGTRPPATRDVKNIRNYRYFAHQLNFLGRYIGLSILIFCYAGPGQLSTVLGSEILAVQLSQLKKGTEKSKKEKAKVLAGQIVLVHNNSSKKKTQSVLKKYKVKWTKRAEEVLRIRIPKRRSLLRKELICQV